MVARRNNLARWSLQSNGRLIPIAFGLFIALGGLILSGCDKIQIPGVNGPAAPAPTAPVAATPVAPATTVATQQPALPPAMMELPKLDGKTAVKNFLEKAKLAGSIEDADLLAVADVKEGLESIQKLVLPGAKVTDKGLAMLSRFPRLTVVDLSSTPVTDEGLKVFKEMPLLESLSLNNTRITDVGLTTISEHPSLKELRLSQTGITDLGLSLLDKLEFLEVLDISQNGIITGRGFEKFRGNKKLRVLYVQHTGIQPGAFKFLKGAPIEDLNLDVTSATNDFAMLSIGSFKKLKHLRMEFCAGVTDFGMSKLTGMKDLETLSVRNLNHITSLSLVPLKVCKKLKSLNINGTLIPDSDAMAFQRLIGPQLMITK
jgi:Leucine-rich repeat (LRR) protein